MPQIQCPQCHGRKITPTPGGNLWQICPVCGGTGSTAAQTKPMPFSYVINPTSQGQTYVAASSQVQGALQIDPKADFRLRKIIFTSTGAFTVQFTDSSGRTWQNLPINSANFGGTAQLPFWVTAPIVLAARTVLNWVVVDTSTANNTIQITLAGEDLYPIGPTTQAVQQPGAGMPSVGS